MRPIHIAHLDKARPVLVLTRELVLPRRQQVTVAPITTTIRGLSTEVPDGPANGIGHESVVSCDNIVTINKAALGERIGYLFPPQETLSPPLPTLPSTSNSGCRFAQHRASSVS